MPWPWHEVLKSLLVSSVAPSNPLAESLAGQIQSERLVTTGPAVVQSLTVTTGPYTNLLQDGVTATPAGVSTGKVRDWGGAIFDIAAYNSTDGAAGTQAAITAAAAALNAGTVTSADVVIPGGLWLWNSVPGIPPNISGAGRLRIRGMGGAVVQLTTGGRRFLDLLRGADYDTFANIEICDLTIDCNNVASSGANVHVVIGPNSAQRININHVAVRRIKTINVPTDPVAIRQNVTFACIQPNNAEGTQNVISDIVVEDCDFGGGNVGIQVKGATNLATDTGCNVFIDRIWIRRIKHTTGAAQTATTGSCHVLVGDHAFGGRCSIEQVRGDYSADVGIEVDNMTEALVKDCEVYNALNYAFYATNFRAPQYPSAQMTTFEDCAAVVDDAAVIYGTGGGKGFVFKASNSIAHGSYQFLRCRYNKQIANNFTDGASFKLNGPTVKHILIEDFTHIEENFDYTSGSAGTALSVLISALGGTPTLEIRNFYVRIQGTRSGGGALTLEAIRIDGAGNYLLNLDRIRFEHSMTGIANGTIRYFNLGPTSGTTLRGKIRAVETVSLSGDSTPTLIRIRASTLLTIANALDFHDCDFSQAAGATEFLIDDATNKAKVYFWNTKWVTFPKPSTAMGASSFAASTFTTATGNQYIGGYPADIHFLNGSGSAITKIEASKDGATYEAIYEQASGAMANDVLCPVDNGDFIKVTFATTQPTTRVRPRR